MTRPFADDQDEWVFDPAKSRIDQFMAERLENLRPKLFAIACRKYPDDRRAAYQLADDALFRVWELRNTFARSCKERGQGNLLSYTVRIVYTSFVDERRILARVVAPPEGSDIVDASPTADELLIERDDVERTERNIVLMHDCLERLSPERQNYVRARYFEFDGSPQARVADKYGVTPANVSAMLIAGLRDLRDCLQGKLDTVSSGGAVATKEQS